MDKNTFDRLMNAIDNVGRPVRDTIIQQDEITDLVIMLNEHKNFDTILKIIVKSY